MKNVTKQVAVAPFWIFPAPYEAQCTQEASGMHGLPQNPLKKSKNPLFRVLGVGPEIPPISPYFPLVDAGNIFILAAAIFFPPTVGPLGLVAASALTVC